MKLRITDARARELAALDANGSRGWFVHDSKHARATLRAERFADGRRNAVAALDFDPCDAVLSAAARNALPDLLADHEAMLAALRRAVQALEAAYQPTAAEMRGIDATAADIRALLASAERKD